MEIPWEKVFSILERLIPAVIASLSVGYNLGQKDKKSLEAKLARAEYELEKLRNEEAARKNHLGQSPRAIVDEYMRSQR